ncbi:hypothetical protein M0813_29895 [Anaeramoeba flamelloides]|uniref:PDZ GRASP-type domain-containing protein n=1 Tax=Anaeramoeba flamelloides TaxID=1746091 RepID=A0ABQ8XLT0_9EUKA|nr:hypothetical protein M0813_29895 [Anaeramoeba flamelloides]
MGNKNPKNKPTTGYQVLTIAENSPASKIGLIPFLDFIVIANGTPLYQDDDTFTKIISENDGSTLELSVYNIGSLELRDVKIKPNSNWGGSGSLGITIRYGDFESMRENVFEVLEVSENSPVQLAGIKVGDFIVGVPNLNFGNEPAFFDYIQSKLNQELQIYIFTKEMEMKEITITPNLSWGGEGCLGCHLGYGILHRIKYKTEKSENNKLQTNEKKEKNESENMLKKENEEEKENINQIGQNKTNETNNQQKEQKIEKPPLKNNSDVDININNGNENENDKKGDLQINKKETVTITKNNSNSNFIPVDIETVNNQFKDQTMNIQQNNLNTNEKKKD